MAGKFIYTSSQYINIDAHAAALQIPQGSLVVWFKYTYTGGITCLFSGGRFASQTTYTYLQVGGNITGAYADESLRFAFARNSPFILLSMVVRNGQGFYADGIEHCAIIVSDGIDNRIYMDGVKESITFQQGNATTANAFLAHDPAFVEGLRISRMSVTSPAQYFDGTVRAVRIYDSNKYINDAEALSIWNSKGNDGITIGKKAHWPLNENKTGQIITNAKDISGNGYDGTPIALPTYEAVYERLLK